VFEAGLHLQRGQEVAFFHMGSTVILIFECPADKNFKFTINPGDKVRLGQTIGAVVNKGAGIGTGASTSTGCISTH